MLGGCLRSPHRTREAAGHRCRRPVHRCRWSAVLLCLAAASGCSRGAALVYDVRVTDQTPRQVWVELKLDGLPTGIPFTLRSYASPNDSRPEQVAAFDATGARLPLQIDSPDPGATSRYTFTPPSSGRARVRYRVIPTEPSMDANTGARPLRKLVLDDRFAF